MVATIAELAQRGFKGPFAVADGRVVHDAGGSEAQELAFALAVAVAYLAALEAGGIALDAARRMIAFRLTADADQFLDCREIPRHSPPLAAHRGSLRPCPLARFRRRRNRMAHPHSRRSVREHPARDHRDVLGRHRRRRRHTLLPFTAARGLPDRFARRLARNTQLVLLEEAGIARVADPTAGTGWSEDLTDKLCRAAWALFQEIEAAGGVAAALEQWIDPAERRGCPRAGANARWRRRRRR